MRLSESFFYTLREDAKDEESASGNLLVKSGMFKKIGNGIYMKMPLGQKVVDNVKNIVRKQLVFPGGGKHRRAFQPFRVLAMRGREHLHAAADAGGDGGNFPFGNQLVRDDQVGAHGAHRRREGVRFFGISYDVRKCARIQRKIPIRRAEFVPLVVDEHVEQVFLGDQPREIAQNGRLSPPRRR